MPLLSSRQQARLTAVFADETHLAIVVTWSIYQRIIAAYAHPDRNRGKAMLAKIIDSLRRGVPAGLDELAQLGRTLWRRRGDVLPTSTTTAPTAPPKPSTDAWKHYAATPSDSATSPTTESDHFSTATSRPTVLKWRGRYEQSGVDGLDDDPRPGRAAVIDEIAVLAETLADKGKPPAHLGVTHWSTRLMANRLGISFASVARIWRKWGIQPHRVETFKFSTDPQLEAKLRDVVGLYLDPLPARWWSASMRKARSRRWIGPSRFCRCAKAFPSSRPTTTSATAPPACSPRWRSPPARSPPTPATRVTPTSSSWPSSSWSPRPIPACGCASSAITTPPTNTPGSQPGWTPTTPPLPTPSGAGLIVGSSSTSTTPTLSSSAPRNRRDAARQHLERRRQAAGPHHRSQSRRRHRAVRCRAHPGVTLVSPQIGCEPQMPHVPVRSLLTAVRHALSRSPRLKISYDYRVPRTSLR